MFDSEFLHSAAKRVGVKNKNFGSPIFPLNNPRRFVEHTKDVMFLDVRTLDPLRPFGCCDPDQAALRIDPKSTVVIPNRIEGLRAWQAIVGAKEGQLPIGEPVQTLRT